MSAWNKDRVDRLKALWLEGRTAEWIARDLGGGFTRSAVLGKVHRLRLSDGRARSTPLKAKPAPHRLRQWTTRAPAPPARPAAPRTFVRPAPDAPPDGAMSILEVRRFDCRWPYGDPADPGFRLCGHRVARGAFCEAHAARAYRGRSQTPESLMRLAGLS